MSVSAHMCPTAYQHQIARLLLSYLLQCGMLNMCQATPCAWTCISAMRNHMVCCRERSDSIPARKASANTGAASAQRAGINVHVLRTDVEDFTDHRTYHG
ncbi:hypothetical protein ABBQ32_001171 [Trebouxia sp. C0010 RCD-2024]